MWPATPTLFAAIASWAWSARATSRLGSQRSEQLGLPGPRTSGLLVIHSPQKDVGHVAAEEVDQDITDATRIEEICAHEKLGVPRAESEHS